MRDDEHREIFTTRDGREVAIEISECGCEIRVESDGGDEIGKILLDDIDGEYFHITWMFLDKLDGSYKRQGIGTQALTLHREIFQTPICASDNDGHVRQDGSHLTGDAPAFVEAMRRKGLIAEPSTREDWGDDV